MADDKKISALDDLNSRYKELESQANSVRYGTSKSKVSGIVNKTKKELEKLRRSKFLASKGLDQATDLTKDTSLKDEFANYKLDMEDDDVKDFYTSQKNSLIQETNDRNDILNRIYGNKEKNSKGEIAELLDDVNKRLTELKDTPEDEKERTELENLVQKIGAKDGGGLLGKLSEDAKKHMSLRRIAVTDFSGAVGEKVNNGAQYVNNDPDVKNSIGSLDKNGHLVTENERAVNEDIENSPRQDEQVTQEQSNASQQPRSTGTGFVGAAAPRATSNVQPTGASPSFASAPVYGTTPQPATPQNNNISYAAKNINDYPPEEYESIVDTQTGEKTGMDYINEFLSDDTSFEEKFDLVNDNEINKKMIEALKDGDFTNEQRNKIIEFSENPMLTMAMYKLKDSGLISEKQYENVKKDASYAKKYYNSLLKGLPAKKKEIDDLTNKLHRTGKKQDQLKIQEQINSLENEYRAYAPLARLKNFKSATENIKNMSTRLNSLRRTFKNLFVKDDKKYLPASEYEKADSKNQKPPIKLNKTEEEFEKEIQEPQNAEKEQEDNKIELENKYIEEGNKYIQDPAKREQWEKNVKENIEGLYGEAILQDSLEVMAALNSGEKLEEVKKIMDKQGHSGGSATVLRDLVSKYSDRGSDFLIYTDPDKESKIFNKANEELNEIVENDKKQIGTIISDEKLTDKEKLEKIDKVVEDFNMTGEDIPEKLLNERDEIKRKIYDDEHGIQKRVVQRDFDQRLKEVNRKDKRNPAQKAVDNIKGKISTEQYMRNIRKTMDEQEEEMEQVNINLPDENVAAILADESSTPQKRLEDVKREMARLNSEGKVPDSLETLRKKLEQQIYNEEHNITQRKINFEDFDQRLDSLNSKKLIHQGKETPAWLRDELAKQQEYDSAVIASKRIVGEKEESKETEEYTNAYNYMEAQKKHDQEQKNKNKNKNNRNKGKNNKNKNNNYKKGNQR